MFERNEGFGVTVLEDAFLLEVPVQEVTLCFRVLEGSEAVLVFFESDETGLFIQLGCSELAELDVVHASVTGSEIFLVLSWGSGLSNGMYSWWYIRGPRCCYLGRCLSERDGFVRSWAMLSCWSYGCRGSDGLHGVNSEG